MVEKSGAKYQQKVGFPSMDVSSLELGHTGGSKFMDDDGRAKRTGIYIFYIYIIWFISLDSCFIEAKLWILR